MADCKVSKKLIRTKDIKTQQKVVFELEEQGEIYSKLGNEVVEKTTSKEPGRVRRSQTSTEMKPQKEKAEEPNEKLTYPSYNKPERNNRRYYTDRDAPENEQKEFCWWHNGDKCKFGDDMCWFCKKIKSLTNSKT